MPDDKGTAMVDELITLAARPRRVDVYTLDKDTDEKIVRKIRVAPMTLDICGDAAGYLREIVEKLGPTINASMVPMLMAEHKTAMRAIIAIATEQPEAYIGSLPLDQSIILAKTVFEVNRDFFVHLVGPALTVLANDLFGGVGLTSSDSSPSTGTETQ